MCSRCAKSSTFQVSLRRWYFCMKDLAAWRCGRATLHRLYGTPENLETSLADQVQVAMEGNPLVYWKRCRCFSPKPSPGATVPRTAPQSAKSSWSRRRLPSFTLSLRLTESSIGSNNGRPPAFPCRVCQSRGLWLVPSCRASARTVSFGCKPPYWRA